MTDHPAQVLTCIMRIWLLKGIVSDMIECFCPRLIFAMPGLYILLHIWFKTGFSSHEKKEKETDVIVQVSQ